MSHVQSVGIIWWKEQTGKHINCLYTPPFKVRITKIVVERCELKSVKRRGIHPIYCKDGCIFGEIVLDILEEICIEIAKAEDGAVFLQYERVE